MRVSEYYRLGRTQPTLDFVDVDVTGDTRVFVDPRALRLLPSPWADECIALIQNFFQEVLRDIRRGANRRARTMLQVLREPNETHLGLSKGKARGRALGSQSAADVWTALSQSQAVQSGLLEDLEDTILLVEGIDIDIISDIATNLIRKPLIRYTQDAAVQYGIPLVPNVDSGPLWDPASKEWYSEFQPFPITHSGKLLLVPKAIVRRKLDYDSDEYFRHYILAHLQEVELSANTELVQLLKDGRRRVTKKALEEKYGRGKSVNLSVTLEAPSILARYRRDKQSDVTPPLDHLDLATFEDSPPPDWTSLLGAVERIPPGRDSATDYEGAIEQLLTALFYPSLANPQVQREIHEGRKRIDITYTNLATEGFFAWLSKHHPSSHIFVECKNYSGDPGNPELDQLSGRFSPSRGKVGILVCRNIQDKQLFVRRCRDTAADERGYVVPLDDSDIEALVRERQETFGLPAYTVLRRRFEDLVL
jgi:hypothetical protein